MKNNNGKIFSYGGEMNPVIVTLFWIAVLVNGALYATGIYFCVMTYNLGYSTQLWNALILNQISMVLATTLVPYAILLDYWCLQKRTITIIYIIGCVIAILFAVIAIVLIMPYGENNSVKDEYFHSTKRNYPWEIISVDDCTCCGWTSPMDYGYLVHISVRHQNDLKAMESLSKCYKTFRVQTSTDGTLRFNVAADLEDMSQGCSDILKKYFFKVCAFISGAMTWSMVYTVVTCFVHLYTIHYKVGHDDNFIIPLQPEEDTYPE